MITADPALSQYAPMLTVAELLIAYLRQLGIEYVFGIPGGAIEPLYNALAASEQSGGPRAIVARHETGAASWPMVTPVKPAASVCAAPPPGQGRPI